MRRLFNLIAVEWPSVLRKFLFITPWRISWIILYMEGSSTKWFRPCGVKIVLLYETLRYFWKKNYDLSSLYISVTYYVAPIWMKIPQRKLFIKGFLQNNKANKPQWSIDVWWMIISENLAKKRISEKFYFFQKTSRKSVYNRQI